MPTKRFFSAAPTIFHGITLFLWMSVIFSFSSLPGSSYFDPPLWYIFERKGAHVFEYAVLMLLSVRFFRAWFSEESFRRILSLAGVCSLAFAATDELHQFFVPYRGAKMSDVAIDGLGILLAGAAIFLILRRSQRNK
jgi:VanZ family protein